jgi:filamentous hemagglutinin family protein
MKPIPREVRRLRYSLLCSTALVMACSAYPGMGRAEPQGGLVVGGAATIETVGPATDIRQSSDRAIIRWDRFDVGAAERVNFHQPSSGSITVNRIHDNKASQIDGMITANGNIVLINQNGIAFGAGSRVDVGGLVATTADLENDADFMAGGAVKLTRPGNPDARIVNHGSLTVQQAGLAGLIAPHIENHGLIEARLGKVVLAAGDITTIDFAGDGLIQIAVSDDVLHQTIRNNGMIRADGGDVLVTAAAGRAIVDSLIVNDGVIQARTTDTGQTGRIRINGSKSTIQNTGIIDAGGGIAQDGGQIAIDASFVSLGGVVSADGKNGGRIDVTAGTLSLADRISAQGLAGDGGTINIQTQKTWETSTSRLNVDGLTMGGMIRHLAEQQIVSSGQYSARGINGMGGQIDASAWSAKFLSAQIDASGLTGGGTIRLGGEYQGGKDLPIDEIPNAYYLIVDRGTRLRAEATGTHGKGGTTILWSDQETVALGTILVKPGTESGDGGFVEISSGETPKFDATIESGRVGRAGTVLLDPKNILISDFSFNSSAIIMGYGYQGGRTNQNTNLDSSDLFGFSVSLDGNRAAIGAYNDDGYNNTMANTGAVYLFSYTDSSFSGGVLEGIIGHGYTGGKNIDLTLDNNDYFGYSVSLDGNRLAVGAYADDGSANALGDGGAVYLFNFADSTFTGGALQATIGKNYTGGKNINLALGGSDLFGTSVALDGNRLAVGALGGDGSANAKTNSGEVFLFSFADSAFTGGVLEANIGNAYSGGKNLGVSLDVNDYFGTSVSLDGNQLIVGAERDDGLGNTLTDAGAAYLISFSDSAFNGATLRSTIGYGYTGGKNINITTLNASDYFGSAVSVDANRFVIGAARDDGRSNVVSDNGAVYLFSHDNDAFDNIIRQGTIGYQYNDNPKDKDLWGPYPSAEAG